MKDFELCVDYKNHDRIRAGFNELAGHVFGLDFEEWFQNGFWGQQYIPYSLLSKGQVVANVSVNQMEFSLNGVKKNYVQIGTVMADEVYRKRGLVRFLMEEVIRTYKDTTQGIYLFANDSVLDFYPKFGFRRGTEYHYMKTVQNQGCCTAVSVRLEGKEDWGKFVAFMKKSICNSSFEMVHNENLIMFYILGYRQENIYFIEDQEAYVIAEKAEDDNLLIHAVFSVRRVDMERLIQAFGSQISQVHLGFTPLDTSGFRCIEASHTDTTLFFLGDGFEELEKNKMMFPVLSHA